MIDAIPIVTIAEADLAALIRGIVADELRPIRDNLNNDTPSEWMTRSQLAAYLGVSLPTVNRHMKEGMPYSRLGEQPRFHKSDIDRWLKDERV
jgi:excisionase family DNA binding protein